ncbi:MAG: MATE family efflux transporter [Clostridia bacterium]|nr:MATE family efflux transporter [Clostridia bacterium]
MSYSRNSSQYERMADTPVPRLVTRLAIPSIITMLVNNLYNLVDTAFVGRLGTSASGAVGVVFGFMSIIQAFGFMMGQGSGSIVSRAFGRKDPETSNLYATAGFFGSFALGLLITVTGFVFLDAIVMFLGSTETIAPFAKTYITYILIAAPFMCSSLTLNNLLRYEGKAFLGMIGLMSGAVLNMIGDPILMFGFGLGIAGAGISTAVSQFIAWGVLLYMFLSGRTESRLSMARLKQAGPAVYWSIMSTGFPSLIRQLLHSLNAVLLNLHCAPYGDAAVAAMSIVSRIIFFTFSTAVGIAQGFQPVSAFNYGAGKYSRVRKGYAFSMAASVGVMIVGCTLILIFSKNLIGLFRDDPAVIEVGTRALRLQAGAYMLLPLSMITEMLFQSTGRRMEASFLSALRSGLLFIPAILILSKLRGLAWIQEAQPLALVLCVPIALLFALRFFRRLPKEDMPVQNTPPCGQPQNNPDR